MRKAEVSKALVSWWTLNAAIMDLSEQDCEQLLQAEKDGQARERFMLRIRSRLNRLRTDREKTEIHEEARQ